MMMFCQHNRQVRGRATLIVTVWLLGWFVLRGMAHEITPAIIDLTFDEHGRYELSIRLNLEALMAEIGPEHSETVESANSARYEMLRAQAPAVLHHNFGVFEARFLDGVSVVDEEERPIEHTVVSVSIPEVGDTDLARTSTIVLASTGAPPQGRIVWSWDRRFGANIIRVTADRDEEGYSAYLTDGGRSDPIPVAGVSTQDIVQVMVNYLTIGFTHILPFGLDHILFVVGLFLLSTDLRSLVIQITSFTVAHTLTLALGFLGVVHIPPTIVEPLIAASIVYVAVENVITDKLQRWRTAVVFCFGLLHGLGFAGVLSEIGVSTTFFVTALLSFNFGVELGQLAVIALCFAVFGWFRRESWYRSMMTVPASITIGLIGLYWFFQRVSAFS